MEEDQVKQLNKILDLVENPDLTISKAIDEVSAKVDEVKDAISNIPQPEMPEMIDHTEHLQFLSEKIDQVSQETQSAINSLSEEVKKKSTIYLSEQLKKEIKGDKGEDGRDGLDGRDGVDGQDGKDASVEATAQKVLETIEIPEETTQSLADKLNQGTEILDVEVIKGYKEFTKKVAENSTFYAQNLTPYQKILRTTTVVTDTYTILTTDQAIICNKATPFTITLPTGTVGQMFILKNVGAGLVTVDGNGTDTIDNELTQPLARWDSFIVFYYESGKWAII